MIKIRIVKFLLIIAISLSSITGLAQIELGIKGAYGYGQYFFQNTVSQYFVPLRNAGITFIYLNEKKAGVQASLLYTQKGWIEKSIDSAKAQFLMDFAELELLSIFKFAPKKKNGLMLKFGPFIGYSFNSNYTLTGQTDTLAINYDSLQSAYKKIDYGIAAGLSYLIKIKKSNLQCSLLFKQGLNHILKKDPAGIFQSISQSLFINFIYTVSLNGKKNKNHTKIKAIKSD